MRQYKAYLKSLNCNLKSRLAAHFCIKAIPVQDDCAAKLTEQKKQKNSIKDVFTHRNNKAAKIENDSLFHS